MITIYTDGSCLKPNGPSGWACVILKNNYEYHLSDGVEQSTNNRMELMAVIEALRFLEEDDECLIYSDSKLVINCAQNIWKRNKNIDLWRIYDEIAKTKTIHYEWVKGHSGNHYNEIVDKLAVSEARNMVQ